MKYGKTLMVMIAIISFAFQACAQSDPLGESRSSGATGSSGDYLNPNMGQMSRDNPDEGVSGMVQWLDQPVTNDVERSTATKAGSAPGPDATKSTTTTTSTSPASESTSTTTETTTSSTPGFEAIFAVAGLLAVTCAKASRL